MTEREKTREHFRRMFPRQGGWFWIVAAALSALQIKQQKKAREAAKEAARKQALAAKENAAAASAQARDNAVQVAKAQQLAQEREALAARAETLTEDNTKAAQQQVEVNLGPTGEEAVDTSKRRRQFFQAGGGSQSGGGLAL